MNEIKTILKAEKRRILRELRDKSWFGAVMVFVDVIFDTVFALLIPQFTEEGAPKGFVRVTPLLCVLSVFGLLDSRVIPHPSVEGDGIQREATHRDHSSGLCNLYWARS